MHLFALRCGFEKAKGEKKNPIAIWKSPYLKIELMGAITPWNNLAGWTLFYESFHEAQADIRLVPSERTIVIAHPSYTEPFTSCIVYVSAKHDNRHSITHELGHCLGFADHVTKELFNDPKLCNPRVCDRTSHHAYHPYSGVMSYCDWGHPERWFRDDDRNMLIEAGYSE